MKKKNIIKPVPSLRELEIAFKRLNQQIAFQRIVAQGRDNIILDMLMNEKKGLLELLEHRTNPKNAVRTTLTKKQQRKAGLLPQV
jgi:hypothetical protein